jgi:membrane-bound metal-dependent hydrolase YbcI (DUF457 family)
MYLVGHAIVAFLVAFGISKKFKIGGISFALVMLIACLPDVDILLQGVGIAEHKTYTHSLIMSITFVPAVIFAIARWRESAGAAAVYSIAYIQHVIIGDIVVGGTDILYPFGTMLVGTGIGYGTVMHQSLEFVLLALAAGIVVGKSFRMHARDATGIFKFEKVDKICYLLLLASIVISFAYLLYGIKVLPRLFIQTNLELALFIILHLSAIAVIMFLILIARQYATYSRIVARTPNDTNEY